MNSKQTLRAGAWLPIVAASSGMLGGLSLVAAADEPKGVKTDGVVVLSGAGNERPLTTARWTLAGAISDRPDPGLKPRAPQATAERFYDNLSMDWLYFSEVQPHRAGDDASFLPDEACAAPVRITSVEFGFFVNPGPGGDTSFDAHCLFYRRLDPGATPVSSDCLGGFILEFRNIMGDQAYTTGPIDLTPIFGQGIPFTSASFFVDIRFYQPGSATELSTRATPILSGTGPRLGSSDDLYWRDADGDGQYGPADARTFGGRPALANFYLALDGFVETGDGGACPADFNLDGALNSQDYLDFVAAFLAGDLAADFNADGSVASQDFFDYMAAFFAGCKPG